MRTAIIAVMLALLVALAVPAVAAEDSFPGKNGKKIAYTVSGENDLGIYTSNPTARRSFRYAYSASDVSIAMVTPRDRAPTPPVYLTVGGVRSAPRELSRTP
jgi:hypothetical protein